MSKRKWAPKLSRWPMRPTTAPSPNAGGPFYRRGFPITTKELTATPTEDPRQAFLAMAEPIRRLVAQCKAMPRGKERNAVELRLGRLLKKQDSLLLMIALPKRQLQFWER